MTLTEHEWAATAAEIDACRQQLRESERVFDRDEEDPTDEFDSDREYLSIGFAKLTTACCC